MFPTLTFVREHTFDHDSEKRLADIGVIVDTDDQGHIKKAELFGPRICDRNLTWLRGLNGIPLVRIGNTSLSENGKKRLRELLTSSLFEDMEVT